MNKIDPATCGKTLMVGLQLALLILIIRLFELQASLSLDVSLLLLGGFLAHAWLPMRFRLGFFLLLSLASIVLVLGVTGGAWTIGLGLGLIVICYLPIQFYARVTLILLAAGALAALRISGPSAPWDARVWPVLTALFMFRLIVYLYDIKHEKGRPDPVRTLSYFFMLPNVLFPLFPVVDYKRFRRNYYNENSENIYQRGVFWMFRGVTHLLLYRVVYQHLTIDPVTANGLAAVLQFSFAAFLLYLQVSGTFHLIVGILLLFGFNLPETNHLYFMASNFNDFWRRINIYWKDFMMKVIYYPVYFRVKRLGETKAIMISTLAVFFCTWLLHAYQWFWLRGTFLLEWHDALYWAVLALLVVGNSLYENKYGRDRRLGSQSRTLLEYAALACSSLATFAVMGLLWGMWSSDSLSQWLSIWSSTGFAWAAVPLVIAGLFASSLLLGNLARGRPKAGGLPTTKRPTAPPGWWRRSAIYTAFMALLYLAGHDAAYSKLLPDAARAVKAFRVGELNARDQAQLERGYYENLIGVNRHATELWDVVKDKEDDWGWTEENLRYTRMTQDLRHGHLLPNVTFSLKGATVTSNRWGLRDRDYALEKPAGETLRIAVLGASHTFGAGVANSETFEAVLEDLLNKQDDGLRYEVLNFAFPGRDAVNQVPVLEMDVLQFEPDVVLYTEHPGAARRLIRNLSAKIADGADIRYDYLASVAQRAKVEKGMALEKISNRLAPFSEEILAWSYERLVTISRDNGIRPVWAHLPGTKVRFRPREPQIVSEVQAAKEAGFAAISLIDVYRGHPPNTLAVAPWDRHPNARAHRLVGELLFSVLSERRVEIFGVEEMAFSPEMPR